jgi:hypothetical protein
MKRNVTMELLGILELVESIPESIGIEVGFSSGIGGIDS